MRILMVCTGNICRSITAHTVLEQQINWALESGKAPNGSPLSSQERQKLEKTVVDSCGVSNEEEGNPPDYRSMAALREAGYAEPEHCARQIRPEDFANFDLILGMTASHIRRLNWLIEGKTPELVEKIQYYRSFDPLAGPHDLEVSDPWYDGNFRGTLAIIERTTPVLIEYILEQN